MTNEPKKENRNGEQIHFSVGAIIKNDKGEYLIIDRVKKPLGFAAIAGHVDQGETAEQAIEREVKEESGLEVTASKLVASEFLDNNPCSRGVNGHDWKVFECTAQGRLLPNSDEVKTIGWYSPEQIKHLNLEPAWQRWFKKLEII